MTTQIALLLLILIATIVLFSFEWVAIDIVALGVLLALILTGLLPLDEAFAGFGSDTAMLFLGLLILTATLVRTGVVELVGRSLQNRTGSQPNRMLAMVMITAAGLSSFISNTAATAFFIPIVMGLARRARVSAFTHIDAAGFCYDPGQFGYFDRLFHEYRRQWADDPVRHAAVGHF